MLLNVIVKYGEKFFEYPSKYVIAISMLNIDTF